VRHRAKGRTFNDLRDAGLPAWAPQTPGGGDQDESVFVWVDHDGTHLIVVGDDLVGTQVASFCREILAGREARRPGEPPTDLSTPVALIHVRPDSFGHGPLGRDHLRPLGELLDFAIEELDPRSPAGPGPIG